MTTMKLYGMHSDRLAEKTIELTFCSQLSLCFQQPIIWFGLTQAQEAEQGFDVCSRLRGRIAIFQFKASNHVLNSGERRFHTHNDQVRNLQALTNYSSIDIYYVLPTIGSQAELVANTDLLGQCSLVDVRGLPSPMPVPKTQSGSARANKMHYFDLDSYGTVYFDPNKNGLQTENARTRYCCDLKTMWNSRDLLPTILERQDSIRIAREARGSNRIGAVIPLKQR